MASECSSKRGDTTEAPPPPPLETALEEAFDSAASLFVAKIVHTIARYRSPSTTSNDSSLNNLSLFLSSAASSAFWSQLMPLHLDVALKDVVAERWVLAYEQLTNLHCSNTTELILLSQSLYSHIRLLPVHASKNMGLRIATADGRLLNSSAQNTHRSFSPTAKLRAYRFKSASTPHGLLHLSVVYDAAISLSVDLHSSFFSSELTTTNATTAPAPSTPSPPGSDSHSGSSSSGSNHPFVTIPPSHGSIPIIRLDENGLEVVEELQPTSPQSYTKYPHNQYDSSSSDDEYEYEHDGFSKRTTNDSLRRESLESLSGKFKSLGLSNNQPPPINTSSPSRLSVFTKARNIVTPQSNNSNNSSSGIFSTTPPVRPLFHQNLSVSYTQHLTPTNGQLPSSPSSHFQITPTSFFTLPAADLLSGSLIGSYEESILNGRMSSLPSKPLPFIADLGVVALGKCKNPALKCPKGLRLCFDACFYEFGGCGGSTSSKVPDWMNSGNGCVKGGGEFEGVSPYVGNVDVEGLSGMVWTGGDEYEDAAETCENGTAVKECGEEGFRKKWIGGWRVPPKGQLQIIIKNPAGTAIKVFLIPYDFRDMPPNTKTFLRQKIYVVKPTATTTPTVSIPPTTPVSSLRRNSLSAPTIPSKDRLRDAIHVHFQCTSRKRIYVTRQVRVVFGHKGLESDEKCRVLTEGPKDPKYLDIPPTAAAVNVGWNNSNASATSTKPFAKEEILSVSPSRRSFSAGNGFAYFHPAAGSLNGGGSGGFSATSTIPITNANPITNTPSMASSTGTSIPRRSSLGVSMMNFAGVSLDHPHYQIPQQQQQLQQSAQHQQQQHRILNISRSIDNFRRPSNLHRHSTIVHEDDMSAGEEEDLFKPQPLGGANAMGVSASSTSGLHSKNSTFWMAPPSNKSSLSIALSLSSGSVSSSAATSGANTPKFGGRSRNVSSSLENLAGDGRSVSMLKMEVLDEVRMMGDEVGVGGSKSVGTTGEVSGSLHGNGSLAGSVTENGNTLSGGNNMWSDGFR
ncbi:UNVERIFIED_CONTAM: hypothetical protein HDU68_001064 [Siphonaria sp. JEL0065]|nr:hypothetical protein HDU68_001064 [Siphonaria sp. JEL0065]